MTYSPTLALSDLTAAYLQRQYLTGLTLCGADGQPLSDEYFEDHIATAIAKLEDITHVDILQRVNTSERHDYRVNDYVAYGFLQLFRLPAQSVQVVRAVYPTGQTIQVFPSEWVRLEISHAQIHLVPTSGTLSQVIIGQGADYLPLIYSGLGYLPHLWEVDYTSGFDPDKVPRMVTDAIMKLTAIEVLTIMSDLIAPLGVASSSLSVDGLSQSISRQLPAFRARIDQYNTSLGLPFGQQSGLVDQIRRTYLGIALSSL